MAASFMNRLRVHDTRIDGSWHQRNSLIFLDAFVIRAKISGDLDLRNAAFSRLWIRSSQIGGTVALDESEARCAYHINSSTIGYLTAENAGFGVIKRATDGNVAVDYSWWYRASYKRDIFDSAPVREIAEAELKRIGERAQFVARRQDLRESRAEAQVRSDRAFRRGGNLQFRRQREALFHLSRRIEIRSRAQRDAGLRKRIRVESLQSGRAPER